MISRYRFSRTLALQIFLLGLGVRAFAALQAPAGFVSRAGDQSIVLHWDKNTEGNLLGYRVYRSLSNGGPFVAQSPSILSSPGFADLSAAVVNGQTNYYRVTALAAGSPESPPSATLAVTPHAFASDDEFLDYVQQTSFDYFWYLANPNNGLVPDRSASGSVCSIAAVGFGLTAIGIGIDHGWIARTQGVARVLTTLNTFLQGPQGTNAAGMIGYKGWFYHFLDMNSATRSGAELSSIDTTLLLAGMLYCKQYFDGPDSNEALIRSSVDAIFNRVDWNWMARGTNMVAMGWNPPGTFISANWVGYNEAMLLYILGLGTATNPLPSSAWSSWTRGYTWATNYGQIFIPFPPLFGHQYSHCWIDFRHIADGYMQGHSSSYFENSRRATLAQRAYCIANPANRVGYGSNVWGLTASDSSSGYVARGAPPAQNDDGTIAPTAVGGSMPFTPEYSVPALRNLYSSYRTNLWTAYGFRDAFNLGQSWYDTDELGIDQGPFVIMIENYRTQRVWRLFMQNMEIQRGLGSAGFSSLPWVSPLTLAWAGNTCTVSWPASGGLSYQVEYSPDLDSWAASPGFLSATNTGTFNWADIGPPVTVSAPSAAATRFYRVFQLGL